MEKIKFTTEEARAFKSFVRDIEKWHSPYYKEKAIDTYLKNRNAWKNDYLPLKKMGLEKFTLALFNGYESVIPTAPRYDNNGITVSYNFDIEYIPFANMETIFCINSENKGISIKEAKSIAETIFALINHYETYIKEGRK